jgi:hypothetical protein
MFVPCVCLQCVGSGFCDELIIRSITFYQVYVCVCVCVCMCACVCLIVCDLDISKMRRLGRNLGCCATKTNLARAIVALFQIILLLLLTHKRLFWCLLTFRM